MATDNMLSKCISKEEKSARTGVYAINVFFWIIFVIATIATLGGILVACITGWFIRQIWAEYHIRSLVAVGLQADESQFPEIDQALSEICERFGVKIPPRVMILNHPMDNAFALQIANKKMIILMTDLLEEIIDKPEQLRFLIGHEMGHVMLDFSPTSWLMLYKTAAYRAGRELTCDNVGLICSKSAKGSVDVLKHLAVGKKLKDRVNLQAALESSNYIYSGLTGWILKQYLTYPPVGKRIENLMDFSKRLKEKSE